MRESDLRYAQKLDLEKTQKITLRQILVLLAFGLGFVAVAVCVIKLHFYIDEMSAIFLIVALVVAVIAGIRPNEFVRVFAEGCHDLLFAGLVIGMCNAVTLIMTNAGIMDTLVYGMGQLLDGWNTSVSACGMYGLQTLLSMVIPSGSGQAAVSMPFMAPLADVLGLTRQTAVLAFQFGDAFTNVVTPTSGELMAALAICHIPYKKWMKFLAPLWGLWAVIACVFLVIAVAINYA